MTFFKHVAESELPYGPLLGHSWAIGKEFYTPEGSTYPCPKTKSPVTDWTSIVEDIRWEPLASGHIMGSLAPWDLQFA